MKFSEAFKVFQLNILRQAGVAVTPQQVGLKSDPIADLQAKNVQSSFDNILSRLGGGNFQGLTAPKPPTPPIDPSDAAANTKYHQEMAAYMQNIQLYNQRFMQLMLQQLQSMQQSMAASRQNDNQSSSTSNISLGVGGILGSSDL